MELNRNHYFMIGVLALFLGVQFRYVESYTLSNEATKFLHENLQQSSDADAGSFPTLFAMQTPLGRKVVRPPRWLGWAFLSTGGVLVLHSLAMKKPGG